MRANCIAARIACELKTHPKRWSSTYQMSDSPELQPHDERDSDKLDYFTVIKNVRMRKGKWQRFSSDQEERMVEEKRGERNK